MNMAKAMEKLAKLGLKVDETVFRDAVDNGPQQRALAQEALLLTLANKPPKLVQRDCGECGMVFGTNYLYVGYCSDHCRRVALDKAGIRYNPTKNEYTAKEEEPLIIPPGALSALRDLLSVIVNPTEIRVHHQEPGLIPGQLSLFEVERVPSSPRTLLSDKEKIQESLGIKQSLRLRKGQKSLAEVNRDLDQLLDGLDF